MTLTDANLRQSVEIFIDELVTDEEFRDAFFRSPRKTLQLAGDWGLPLSESEIQRLRAAEHFLWERVVDQLDIRLQEAA